MKEINTQEQVQELLKDSPELQRFSNRMRMIGELVEDAEKEADLAFMADSFKTVLRLQERLHAEMLTWNSEEYKRLFNGMEDNCRGWKDNAEKLEAALKEERQENSETFDKMCFLLVVNPRSAFEDVILKSIERQKKIEDTSGQSWYWCLRFSFIARLRMAFKLMFGRKGIDTAGDSSAITL